MRVKQAFTERLLLIHRHCRQRFHNDVRTAGEYQSGHLDDALHIPLDDLRERVDELEELPSAAWGNARTMLRASCGNTGRIMCAWRRGMTLLDPMDG